MPAPVGAHVMKHISLKLNGTEYANQYTTVLLIPDTPIQQMRVLVPDGTISDVDSAIWTVQFAGPQIWLSTGLAKFLNDNAGSEVDAVYIPRYTGNAGDERATFTFIATAVEFGGTAGSFRTFDRTFPIVGQPDFDLTA